MREPVPYTVFLVRGRSKKEQPAIVVLLDGDRAGLEAATALQEAYGKPIVDEKYVTTISAAKLPAVSCDRFGGPKDIEDLVTPAVMLEARAVRRGDRASGVAVPAVDDLRSRTSPLKTSASWMLLSWPFPPPARRCTWTRSAWPGMSST
ncbi:MAG: hypothetical protein R2689_01440 [Microthrixaceae bacterium]